jgi:hypothetical protein
MAGPAGESDPVTMAALMAAMPHVRAAPKGRGPVAMLCHRPGFNRREFPGRLRLTRAEGVPGDRWLTHPWLRAPDGAPDPRIQVSILPHRVLDLVWRERDRVPHPGDTIVADLDTSLEALPPGTLLRAGSATLRVSDLFNEGCVKWKVRYGRDALAWITAPGHPALRLRGVLCEVVEDGEVAVTDELAALTLP